MQIDEICGENAKKRQKRQKRPKLVLKNEIGGSACHFPRPKIKGVLALIFPDVTFKVEILFYFDVFPLCLVKVTELRGFVEQIVVKK